MLGSNASPVGSNGVTPCLFSTRSIAFFVSETPSCKLTRSSLGVWFAGASACPATILCSGIDLMARERMSMDEMRSRANEVRAKSLARAFSRVEIFCRFSKSARERRRASCWAFKSQ